MRTVLLYHRGSRLDDKVLAPWLASWSELVGTVVIEEPKSQHWRRVKREFRRVGPLRLVDVLGFRIAYRLGPARRDRDWESQTIHALAARYGGLPDGVPELATPTPNSDDVVAFLQRLRPDVMLARCKLLIDERVFSVPARGTFVLHPGATPEYRNSHGCFWALVHGDRDKVVASLVQIDSGVDTGPVYGYFSYPFDECSESHVVIQKRVVTENLDAIAERFREIDAGTARPIDVTGRRSAAWGQPWLTAHRRYRASCRNRVIALGYHDVVGTDEDESGFKGAGPAHYKLDWTTFGRHLEQIDSAMGRPPARASDLLTGGSSGSWLLTFDDGGASSVPVAEMLAERGWPAHFFITTDRIGEPGFVTATDVRRLRELGHEVGSHSCSHPERMSRATRTQLDHEWRDSLRILSAILGEPVTVASVPGGYFSDEVAAAAADAGVEVLFTSEPEPTPHRVGTCLVVGRMSVTAATTPERAAALAAGRRSVVVRAWASWNAKKLVKIAAGPAYLRLRRMVLSRR